MLMLSGICVTNRLVFSGGTSMRIIRRSLTLALIFSMVSSAGFAQERHVVDPALLIAAVTQHVASQDADRTAIREALTRPQVREIASRFGLDVDRVAASVNAFSESELQRTAAAARQVNQSFAGGASTVSISTTTIIIALLVVILIIVAVK
jgi:hypothetical protein